ncbi:MAG: helix-turn-helix transcriptional regulator [Thermoplasmata archaeon]|nr:helix-turn-helix transcriptional regulator [Thermoplasmata archaeon]
MDFEIRVKNLSPMVGEEDYRKVAEEFLKVIGYMGKNDGQDSIAFKLFELFLIHPEKKWMVEELMMKLNATKATIYRHLNKLKSMDILEEGKEGKGKNVKKTYGLRYGNIAKAWSFVEAHVKVAMENYNENVNHLQKLVERRFFK